MDRLQCVPTMIPLRTRRFLLSSPTYMTITRLPGSSRSIQPQKRKPRGISGRWSTGAARARAAQQCPTCQ
eukprot:991960-Pyramimonas_sp.AAC.1